MTDPIRVGVLGFGNVGSALVQMLLTQSDAIADRTGLRLELGRVAVRDPEKQRKVEAPARYVTGDAMSVVSDPDIDVIVEVIGGVDPARDLILTALKSGKPVISANKELLATSGSDLFAAANDAGLDLLFEAAVGGGIPLIRPLRESLAGEQILRVLGIVNGTTNYILTRMEEAGASYSDALAEAQALGYAESDPTADVEGHDAAAKAAVIASIAFGAKVTRNDVYCEGITNLSTEDLATASNLGFSVKLLAIAESIGNSVAVKVHPTLVPRSHPLASVRESFNAVFIEGETVGELMLYGRGAGGEPTASAVMGDLVDAAHNLRAGGTGRTPTLRDARIVPIGELLSEFYLTLEVTDRPGVLATVASIFGDNNVSIRSTEQEGLADEARLYFITHAAKESDMQKTVESLNNQPAVRRVGSLIRLIDRRP